MHQTFEEFVGQHIDGLYHGALFLNAGEEPPAEDLVLWTLTGAFQEFRQMKEESASEPWLEGKLVDVFLARTASGSTAGGSIGDGSADDGSTDALSGEDLSADMPSTGDGSVEIDPDALFRAAVHMPPLARAAVWLVVFCRWTYGEAANGLGADVDGLKDLLRYRQVLLKAVVRRSVEGDGTDPDGRG